MNIDWDNAPKGTEAAHPGNTQILPAWFRRDTAGLVEQICPAAGINAWTWMGGRRDFPHGHILRPAPDNQAWSGEGLPPVGTVCEFAGGTECPEDPFDKDLKEGMKVTIIAHFKCGDFTLAAFTFDPENPDRGMTQVEQGNFGCFRLIRTPEQISAEEIKDIESWLDANIEELGSVAKTLHESGFRKRMDK